MSRICPDTCDSRPALVSVSHGVPGSLVGVCSRTSRRRRGRGPPMEAHITSGPAAEQLPAPRSPRGTRSPPGGPLRAGTTGPPGGPCPAGGRWLRCSSCRRLLSLRLVRADTAFQDEALYLWAGHLEWAHWLHGTAVPPFPYYFSGAPVIYPPLGALADARRRPGRRPDPVPGRSCSAATALLWALPGGCSGGGPRSSPRRCSRCWARRCTWARSPPTTPCRCSSWRWRPGGGPRRAERARRPAG